MSFFTKNRKINPKIHMEQEILNTKGKEQWWRYHNTKLHIIKNPNQHVTDTKQDTKTNETE
jgi:hypothetical protein